MCWKKTIVLISCILIIGCSGPWEDLSKTYGASKAPQSDKSMQHKKTVVLSGINYKAAHSFRGIVTLLLTDGGVYLSQDSPYSWMHKPLQIPLSAITACSRTQWSTGWDTNLWLSEVDIEIGFPDNDQVVLNWCEKHNIKIVNRETAIKWLYKKTINRKETGTP